MFYLKLLVIITVFFCSVSLFYVELTAYGDGQAKIAKPKLGNCDE